MNSEPASYEVKSSLSLCTCKLSFDMRFEAIEEVLREFGLFLLFFFSIICNALGKIQIWAEIIRRAETL